MRTDHNKGYRSLLKRFENIFKEQQYVIANLKELLHDNRKKGLKFTMQTTDDYQVSFRAEGVDADGISTGVITNASATVDNEDVATVKEDSLNPGSYLVTRNPASDKNEGKQTVTVTIEDIATGRKASQSVEFDPGAASSIVHKCFLAADVKYCGSLLFFSVPKY